jgi:hypothetical protein
MGPFPRGVSKHIVIVRPTAGKGKSLRPSDLVRMESMCEGKANLERRYLGQGQLLSLFGLRSRACTVVSVPCVPSPAI